MQRHTLKLTLAMAMIMAALMLTLAASATAALSLSPLTAPSAVVDASSVAFTPDGLRFVVGGIDSSIKTFKANGELESELYVREYINCVDVSPDGRFLVAGGDSFTLEVFERECDEGDGGCQWLPFQSFSAPLELSKKLKKHERYNFLLGKVMDVSFSVSQSQSQSLPLSIVVASGGWETGIVALLQWDEAGSRFRHKDTFSSLFTKWAISADFRSFGGRHVLAASPDQAISILEVTAGGGGDGDRPPTHQAETGGMTKPLGSPIKWYIRDDNDRWQAESLIYDYRGSDGNLVEFHRLSNNIQNLPATATNNFVRAARWLKVGAGAGAYDFVTVGHEGHIRVYVWNQEAGVFNATLHWQDTVDGTPVSCVAVGYSVRHGVSFFVTGSHGRHINLVERERDRGGTGWTWRHVQRLKLNRDQDRDRGIADANSGIRAVAVSPDGSQVVVVGRSVAIFNVVDGGGADVSADALNVRALDDEIRDRHYRIE